MAIRTALRLPDHIAGVILASPLGAPLDQETLARLKRLFSLCSHTEGLNFMDLVTARPDKVNWLLKHVMSWVGNVEHIGWLPPPQEFMSFLIVDSLWLKACRNRVSTPTVRKMMEVASANMMLSKNEVSSLRPPVLLIWGQHEKILPRHCLDFFRRHLPPTSAIIESQEFGHVVSTHRAVKM